MFFTYLWQSIGLSEKDASDKFSAVLSKQCKLYSEAFGEEPSLKIKQINNVFIGQIHYDPGITGWEPWIDRGDTGIIWNGVCESYLGRDLGKEGINDTIKILSSNPGELSSWDGRFSVITWNKNEDRILITTAATECPTSWYTEGNQGWASGPHAAPLLELADRKRVKNTGGLGLYLLYGHFLGGQAPFEHVSRLKDRQQVVISRNLKPKIHTYISLQEYVKSGQQITDWKEIISFAGDRLVQRVNRQLSHSIDPVIQLTGGKDSRSIVASAKKTGLPFETVTRKLSDPGDVTVAANVANALNVKHHVSGDSASEALLCESVERMKLWARISEGILPLNYFLHLTEYYKSNLPFPVSRSPIFSGIQPETGHAFYYNRGHYEYPERIKSMSIQDAHDFMTQKNHVLKLDTLTHDLLQDCFTEIDHMNGLFNGAADKWLDLFYWRQRCLTWGMDLQSVYSPVRWAWMPLFDRELINISWNFTFEQKVSDRFLREVTAAIEPALAKVNYIEHSFDKVSLASRIKRRAVSELNGYLRKLGISNNREKRPSEADPDFRRLWDVILFSKRDHMWKEFIDEKDLVKMIRLNPGNVLLWRLSTIDLLTDEYF